MWRSIVRPFSPLLACLWLDLDALVKSSSERTLNAKSKSGKRHHLFFG
jgi:hypothetical protein